MVIVVDGTSWPRVELSELNKTANLLKRIHKTEIYAIGIGTAVANSGEMIEIASGTHGDGSKFEQYAIFFSKIIFIRLKSEPHFTNFYQKSTFQKTRVLVLPSRRH